VNLRSFASIFKRYFKKNCGQTRGRGANLVLKKLVFPLTPRFSAVEIDPPPNRFNGFFALIPIKPGSLKTAVFQGSGGSPR
jgi:hypothetical protein